MNVLARVDKALTLLSWLAAAAVVLMLFLGPQIVANDKAGSSRGAAAYAGQAGGAADGKQVFTANCGSCHTLSAAGTSGQVGPDLDRTSLTAGQVATKVRQGGGVMPSFTGKISDAQISAVAAFVARAR